ARGADADPAGRDDDRRGRVVKLRRPGVDSHRVADVLVTSCEEALRSPDRLARLKAHALSMVVGAVPADVASIVSVTRRRELSGAIALCSPSSRIGVDDAARALDAEDLNAGVVMLDAITAALYLRTSGTLVAVVTLQRAAGVFSRADAA